MVIHIVSQGDSIFKLAQLYSSSTQRIISDNGLHYPYTLAIGQALIITKPKLIHKVRVGDTPYTIALAYGITIYELFQNNPELSYGESLHPDQSLVISWEGEKLGSVALSAYAYPHVNRVLLQRTLPFLTYLHIFSYGFSANGSINTIEDKELLTLARAYGALPVMVLSSLDEGHFSTVLASKLFNDLPFQEEILDRLVQLMLEKGYHGLDADFEFIDSQDAFAYVAFLEHAKEKLHTFGLFLHCALAPKTSSDQEGLLYEGHLYEEIGDVTDNVLLMTYEWGYTYGPPMAVAPLNKVEEVVAYGVSQIPPEKILMGIPNYGYDWILPYVQGASRATSIGHHEAVSLAVRYGSEILFDETAQSPYFHYVAEGITHEVWFEDIRSIEGKFSLIENYNLYGAGYWNAMRPFAQNWAFLAARYNIIKLNSLLR